MEKVLKYNAKIEITANEEHHFQCLEVIKLKFDLIMPLLGARNIAIPKAHSAANPGKTHRHT